MKRNYLVITAFATICAILSTSCSPGKKTPGENSPLGNNSNNTTVTEGAKKNTPAADKDQLIAKAYAYTLKQPVNHNSILKDDKYNLNAVERVRAIGMITGEASENRTRSKYQVGGTDLGIFIEHKDKMYLFFGDTFRGDDKGKPMEGGAWRSNVLAYTTDFDASDGLIFDGMILSGSGSTPYAKELIASKKVPGSEHTVIPTGGFSDGQNMYAFFMSVKSWGGPGGWTINYGGLAKSTDDGKTFNKLSELIFDGTRFGQIAPLQVDDYLYCMGIGGGRFGSARLMRVKIDSVEKLDEYEYLTGFNGKKPVYKKGAHYVNDAITVVDGQVGEPSIMYNKYLGEYVITYLKEDIGSIVMRVAKNLEGPWSEPLVLVNNRDYPALYGGFVHQKYTKEDGRYFYFTMSIWDPVYNSGILEVEVSKKSK